MRPLRPIELCRSRRNVGCARQQEQQCWTARRRCHCSTPVCQVCDILLFARPVHSQVFSCIHSRPIPLSQHTSTQTQHHHLPTPHRHRPRHSLWRRALGCSAETPTTLPAPLWSSRALAAHISKCSGIPARFPPLAASAAARRSSWRPGKTASMLAEQQQQQRSGRQPGRCCARRGCTLPAGMAPSKVV